MPQMMPLSWTSLYLFFIMSLMMFTFMNYYMNIKSPENMMKTKKEMNKMSWKW